MTDTNITAYCAPQDPGTGVPQGSADRTSAVFETLMGQAVGTDYVANGIEFSNVQTTSSGGQVTLTAGHCYFSESGNEFQSGSQTDYNQTLPAGSDHVYVVVLPDPVTITLNDADAENEIFIAIDPTTNDSVYVRHGSGETHPEDTSNHPGIHVGHVDTTDGSTVRHTDLATTSFREVEAAEKATAPSYSADSDAPTDTLYHQTSEDELRYKTGAGAVLGRGYERVRYEHFVTIPMGQIPNGTHSAVPYQIPDGGTLEVYVWGVRNNDNPPAAPTDLSIELYDMSNDSFIESASTGRESGDPGSPVTATPASGGNKDVQFRVVNETGSEVTAGGYVGFMVV